MAAIPQVVEELRERGGGEDDPTPRQLMMEVVLFWPGQTPRGQRAKRTTETPKIQQKITE